MSTSANNDKRAPNPLCLLDLLVFLSLLIVTGCGNEQEEAPEQGVPVGRIEQPVAYISHPNAGRTATPSERELMVVDAASGKTWQLTSNRADDQAPVWSPSGTHLMYLSRPVSMKPGMRSEGEYRVMVHELKSGKNREIDLSWAKKSGPASPRGDGVTKWLECAAWSPLDSTKVAVGVMVRGPMMVDVKKLEEMTIDELSKEMRKKKERQKRYRIVLIDVEDRTVRLVAKNRDSCFGISWSPNGEYLHINAESGFDYLEVDTGEKHTITGGHTVAGKPLSYAPTGWAPNSHSLLVRGYLTEADTLVAYRYDVERETWSEPLGGFGGEQYVLEYAPSEETTANAENLDLVLLRREENSYHDDLWLYQRPESTFKRLTEDRMPKMQDAASYHVR